jgi:pyrroloquinoline quinone biosynthesis protein E
VLAIARRVRRDAPLEQVVLSGGEPMLRPDLADIVCDLADEGLDSAVITSGVLLGTERLRRFPEDTLFEVTLLGGDRVAHDRLVGREAFDRVLRGLLALRRHRCRFVLVVVVTAQNANDVGRIMRAGLAMGAEAILLNRVNLTRRTLALAPALVPAPEALHAALRTADNVAARYGIGVSVSVPVPPCVVDPREFRHLHFGWCPRGGEEAYYTVGSTGVLRPCNHSTRPLGDVRRARFGAIVRSAAARSFWAPVPEPCRECTHPLAGVCRGGCPAAADECHGSRSVMDPFVAASMGRGREASSNRQPRAKLLSSTTCVTPRRERQAAAASPAGPAPTTIASRGPATRGF